MKDICLACKQLKEIVFKRQCLDCNELYLQKKHLQDKIFHDMTHRMIYNNPRKGLKLKKLQIIRRK